MVARKYEFYVRVAKIIIIIVYITDSLGGSTQ